MLAEIATAIIIMAPEAIMDHNGKREFIRTRNIAAINARITIKALAKMLPFLLNDIAVNANDNAELGNKTTAARLKYQLYSFIAKPMTLIDLV